MKTKGFMTGIVLLLIAVTAYGREPVVSDVVVRQRWPWDRRVDIDYVLTCEVAQRMDITVTGYNGAIALSLPAESLSGDLYGVSQGARRIVWDPMKTAYTNGSLSHFRVVVTPTQSPVYMIVDLTLPTNHVDQITYIYPGDSKLETYGKWTNVWFAVTNDITYKTGKLVLRRIHAGTYKKGLAPGVETAVPQDFYMGLFEVTQWQWERIMGTKPSYFTTDYAARPVERVSYNMIRGATNGVPVIDWPSTGSAVSPDSFMGKLREKTGLSAFDLPTEAQWEYTCRAGTTTLFNDGEQDAKITGSEADNNGATNKYLNVLGRYIWNGGYFWYEASGSWGTPPQSAVPASGTAIVGSYLTNGWGLYDMHGNIFEYCLDWYWNLPGTRRALRGGGCFNSAAESHSALSASVLPDWSSSAHVGLRLVMTLP